MREGKAAEAATQFVSPAHRAMARYESGDMAGAMEDWLAIGDAASEYNLGTALTQAGDYQRAIDAFDRATSLPGTPAGNAHNRDIAEKLLALQEAQSESSGEGEQGGEQGQSGSDSAQSAQASPAEQGEGEDAGDQPTPAEVQEQEQTDSPAPSTQRNESEREGAQAAEQLLNRVPDDPAGLLRARIMREHQRRHNGARDATNPW